MLVLLVRHGETEWSRTHRHTGLTDIPLSPAGRDQARALAPRLSTFQVDAVLCSPLRRALETASLLGLGPPITIDRDLREWDYGAYEGLTTVQIETGRTRWDLWRDGVPGGETLAEVAARADAALATVGASGTTVALIAHGHFLRVLAARWLELPARAGAHLALDTAALSALSRERETPVIQWWNQTS